MYSNRGQFRRLLWQPWFKTFRRNGVLSSGFRHTFAGDQYYKRNPRTGRNEPTVGGFHNWVQYYQLDVGRGVIQYCGYISQLTVILVAYHSLHNKKTTLAYLDHSVLVDRYWLASSIRRTLGQCFWLGTSPFFEICAYIVCALLRPGNRESQFSLNG